MDLQRFLCWRLAPLFLLTPSGLHCMSVHVTNEEPVHVVPGASLVLRARIDPGPLEEVSSITWAREPETGTAPARVTLATCPGGGPECAGTGPNVHVHAEQQETTLQIDAYGRADGGVYAVTVTDHAGDETTARCVVREYVYVETASVNKSPEAVHHVSLSINVSHPALVCGEALGTEPSFSWLHERAAITGTVGRVSKDGATLFLSMSPVCGHFTCIVSNKLGYSSATYSAGPCETEGRGTTAAVVCLLLLLLLGGGLLAFLLWRRHRLNDRGERLREHLDDGI